MKDEIQFVRHLFEGQLRIGDTTLHSVDIDFLFEIASIESLWRYR